MCYGKFLYLQSLSPHHRPECHIKQILFLNLVETLSFKFISEILEESAFKGVDISEFEILFNHFTLGDLAYLSGKLRFIQVDLPAVYKTADSQYNPGAVINLLQTPGDRLQRIVILEWIKFYIYFFEMRSIEGIFSGRFARLENIDLSSACLSFRYRY